MAEKEGKKKKEADKKASKNDEVKKLKEEISELKNEVLRARADFENFRKRNEQEKFEIRQRTIVDFAEQLIPTIENFEMSLIATDNKEMFIKGVQMIHENLLRLLEEHKITSFEPKIGEKFDPVLHEPILIEDNNETHKPGHILTVLKKGYKHNQLVIVPAKVQVKKDKGQEIGD
jgi:molecular chaperone GrpE